MEKKPIKETKVKAIECVQDCICQTEGGTPCCKITGTVSRSFFFTESRHPDGCPQQHAFGSTYICTCPVRQDIYLRTNR